MMKGIRFRPACIATTNLSRGEHRRFKRGTANMAAPFRGFLTSRNGSSVDYWGTGRFSGGTAREFKRFRGAAGGFHEQFRWNEAQRGTPRPGGAFRKRSRRDGNGVRNGPA